jgi:amino acid transporter
MVFGPHFQAFRIVLYITIVITIIVILIDPIGVKTRAIEQTETGTSPWIARWFSLAVLGLLYFICATGRGHLAWVVFVLIVLMSAFITIFFQFILPMIDKTKAEQEDIDFFDQEEEKFCHFDLTATHKDSFDGMSRSNLPTATASTGTF